jgi:hypothetical protein
MTRAAPLAALALFACLAVGCGDDSDGDGDDSDGDGSRDAAAGAGGGDAGGAGRDAAAAGADAGSAPAAGSASPSAPVSFSNDVAPIFAAKCTDCHHDVVPTHLDLTEPFDPEVGLVNNPSTWDEEQLLVEPSHPERSFLVKKIVGDDLDHEGAQMPLHLPRLDDEQIEILETWIADGALDDDLYRDEVVYIFGDGMTLGSKAGRCAFCHYEGGDLHPNLMNPFDPETGAVGVVGAYGRVLIEPGDPDSSFLMEKVRGTFPAGLGQQMPLWHDPVTDEELAVIELWIAEGAADN